jgi:hypothetical protein
MKQLTSWACLAAFALAACMVGDADDGDDVGDDEEQGVIAYNPNPPELAVPAANLTAADCVMPAGGGGGAGRPRSTEARTPRGSISPTR